MFAAPHGLSQRTTSFIASQRQGIHRILLRHLIALIIDAHRSAAVSAHCAPIASIERPVCFKRTRERRGQAAPTVTEMLDLGQSGPMSPEGLLDTPERPMSTGYVSSLRCGITRGRLLDRETFMDGAARNPASGGARRDRTDDLMLAKHALSQLSYGPVVRARRVVGLGRLELPTSRLSSARSNQLSYKPLTLIPLRTMGSCRCSPSACSSAKKEKRRRRNPANGAQRSGDLLAPDVSKTIR